LHTRLRFVSPAIVGFLAVGLSVPSWLSAQLGRRPPDNPSGNVNSHTPTAYPTFNVPYDLILAGAATGPTDTAGLAAAARGGPCVEQPLLHYFMFTSASTYLERDSTRVFCWADDGSDSLTSTLRNVRMTGHYYVEGMEFQARPDGPTDSDAVQFTGWLARDTLFIDQDCDGGGLPFVRRRRTARAPQAIASRESQWFQPCG
jgi:hypothetical protein